MCYVTHEITGKPITFSFVSAQGLSGVRYTALGEGTLSVDDLVMDIWNSMYFWNDKNLACDLRCGVISEKQQMLYLQFIAIIFNAPDMPKDSYIVHKKTGVYSACAIIISNIYWRYIAFFKIVIGQMEVSKNV